MGLFGKDNSEEMNKVISQINSNTKTVDKVIESLNGLNDRCSSLQESMIKIAAVQAQHAAIVKFLMNHATVDEDSKADADKMMQDIFKNAKLAKGKNNG